MGALFALPSRKKAAGDTKVRKAARFGRAHCSHRAGIVEKQLWLQRTRKGPVWEAPTLPLCHRCRLWPLQRGPRGAGRGGLATTVRGCELRQGQPHEPGS